MVSGDSNTYWPRMGRNFLIRGQLSGWLSAVIQYPTTTCSHSFKLDPGRALRRTTMMMVIWLMCGETGRVVQKDVTYSAKWFWWVAAATYQQARFRCAHVCTWRWGGDPAYSARQFTSNCPLMWIFMDRIPLASWVNGDCGREEVKRSWFRAG